MKHLFRHLSIAGHDHTSRLLSGLAALLLVVSIMLLAGPGLAIDLQSAKDQGLVGETPSGYLEAVGTPTAEVASLVKTINEKRRARYLEIAKKNGTDLAVVEKLAGRKAIEKTRPGNYIKINGKWVRKK
ncbi:YdbL family protein [Desulfolithobacter sp.]